MPGGPGRSTGKSAFEGVSEKGRYGSVVEAGCVPGGGEPADTFGCVELNRDDPVTADESVADPFVAASPAVAECAPHGSADAVGQPGIGPVDVGVDGQGAGELGMQSEVFEQGVFGEQSAGVSGREGGAQAVEYSAQGG